MLSWVDNEESFIISGIGHALLGLTMHFLKPEITALPIIIEPWHVISNNVEFDKCRLRPACAASF